jgi:hypothetical protein
VDIDPPFSICFSDVPYARDISLSFSNFVFIGIEDLFTAGRRSEPGCPLFRLLAVLLPAERSQIEEIIGPPSTVSPPPRSEEDMKE